MYLGLDLSLTGTGAVIIDDDYKIIHQAVWSNNYRSIDRLEFIYAEIDELIAEYHHKDNIDYAVLESPAFGVGNQGRLFDLGDAAGIVKLELAKNGIEFSLVSPQGLKKYISGKQTRGNKSTKDLVILDIYKKYGVEFRENNIADAYVLARIAHDLCCDCEIDEYQREVLKVVRKNDNDSVLL